MSKKIMLLALAAISAAFFALPSLAMAEDVYLHVNPKPTTATAISGGKATLTTVGGNTVTCNTTSGSASWESSTTGTLNLTFSGSCVAFGIFPCESIKTNTLPFHLVTLPGSKPGVLITAPTGGVFAKFSCSGAGVEVTGNGIIGTITSPACGGESTSAVISFKGTKGVQEHKKVEGTETSYHLVSNGEEAAQEATGTVTFPTKTKLECT